MYRTTTNVGDAKLNHSNARKAVRQRAQADGRKISIQQKAQDSGIDYWLQYNRMSQMTAPMNGLDATADLILANHLISNGLNSQNISEYGRYHALTEHQHPESRPTRQFNQSSTEGLPLTSEIGQVLLEPPSKAQKTFPSAKMWDGQMVLNQKMQPLKSRRHAPRTDQQNKVRKMTKAAGGACARHKRLKQFVS